MKVAIIFAIVINLVTLLIAPEIGAVIKKDISLRAAIYVHNLPAHERFDSRGDDAVIQLHRDIREEIFDPSRPHLLIAIPSLINTFALLLILALCYKQTKEARIAKRLNGSKQSKPEPNHRFF